MNYTRNIYLDVNATTAVTVVKAKQGDDSLRYINITLQKDGVRIVPEAGCTAVFRLEKPDGTSVVNSATIESDGTITVTLTTQCTAISGKCNADIVIQDSNNKTISTAVFVLEVVKSPDIANQIASSNEYGILVDLIAEAEALVTENALCSVNIQLSSSGWSQSGTVYTHSLTITGYTVTQKTKVDLLCDATALNQLVKDNVTSIFVANNSGTLTLYAINGKPSTSVTVQAILTEVKPL